MKQSIEPFRLPLDAYHGQLRLLSVASDVLLVETLSDELSEDARISGSIKPPPFFPLVEGTVKGKGATSACHVLSQTVDSSASFSHTMVVPRFALIATSLQLRCSLAASGRQSPWPLPGDRVFASH